MGFQLPFPQLVSWISEPSTVWWFHPIMMISEISCFFRKIPCQTNNSWYVRLRPTREEMINIPKTLYIYVVETLPCLTYLSCSANGREPWAIDLERNIFSLSFQSFSARSDGSKPTCHPSRLFFSPKDCFRYQLLHQRLIGDFPHTEDVRAVAWVDADSFSLKNLDTLLEVCCEGFGPKEFFPPKCGGRWIFFQRFLASNKCPETFIEGKLPRKVGMKEVRWLWGTPFVRVPFGYVSGDIF